MLLFIAPFLIMGLGAFCSGIIDYIKNPVFTEDIIARLGVGGIFTLVASCFIAVIFYGKRKLAKVGRLKELHPDSPWLWNEAWSEGRVKSSTPMSIFIFWLFGLAFGGAGIGILFKLDEITSESPMGYLALLFPLVGFAMLCSAIYATLRWFKYGRVYCDLVTNPGVIGGWNQHIIWAKIKMAPSETVEAQLTCYHCYTSGSGDNRNHHRDVKWQETISIPQERMMVEADGTLAIPIKIYVPRDCTPTTPESPSTRHEWELSAKADVAGIDFVANFIVPVFVTEDSTDESPGKSEEEEFRNATEPYIPTILITEGMDSLELYAPPRRGVAKLLSITIFSMIWTAIVFGMIFLTDDIPIIFPIVFGFFDILIVWMALWMWFGKARVRIEFGAVHISKTVLGFGSRKTVEAKDISDVDAHINMQSGNVPYYVIRLHTSSGTKNTVGGIRNKDEAEDLVRRVKEAIG